MSATPVLAYLDAGTGAALAAVIASGAVGGRALLANAKGKFRRRPEPGAEYRAEAPEPETHGAERA